MNQERLRLIAGTGAWALLTAALEGISAPQAVLVVLSVPLVFIFPGFVTVCTVLPGRDLAWGERLLTSLAASLGISTGIAVLLAASPIGLSRGSVAATLGLGTAAVSLWAWLRTRRFLEEDGRARERATGGREVARRDQHDPRRYQG
jgi:uncharacterized membrane protein